MHRRFRQPRRGEDANGAWKWRRSERRSRTDGVDARVRDPLQGGRPPERGVAPLVVGREVARKVAVAVGRPLYEARRGQHPGVAVIPQAREPTQREMLNTMSEGRGSLLPRAVTHTREVPAATRTGVQPALTAVARLSTAPPDGGSMTSNTISAQFERISKSPRPYAARADPRQIRRPASRRPQPGRRLPGSPRHAEEALAVAPHPMCRTATPRRPLPVPRSRRRLAAAAPVRESDETHAHAWKRLAPSEGTTGQIDGDHLAPIRCKQLGAE